MRNKTFHTTLALLLGAISIYIYFALLGVIAVWSNEHRLYGWIFSLPKSYQKTAFLIHNDLEGFIVAIPILGFFGLLLGMLTKKNPFVYGFLEYLGAISFFFGYHIFVLKGNFMWVDSVPAWSQIAPFFMWLFIFVCASIVGSKKIRPRIYKYR